jgi:hypothetical protein
MLINKKVLELTRVASKDNTRYRSMVCEFEEVTVVARAGKPGTAKARLAV